MKLLVLSILITLLLAGGSAADDFIYQGSFLWNNIRAVVHGGDYLFCAFHNGIGTVDLSQDFVKKKLFSTLELPSLPRRLFLYSDILVVDNELGKIDLVDVANPADMRHLGSMDYDFELLDAAVLGDYLYLAAKYDGLLRYDISDPGNILFDDSSMAGIRIIDLDIYDSRLYALDDYNGVLIYEPQPADIGEPVSELLLPQQGISLAVAEDTVYAGLKPNGYMLGTVADVYNPEYLGSRSSFIRGDYVTLNSRGLVLANSINGFEVQYDEGMPGQVFPVDGIVGYPEIYEYRGEPFIAYANDTRGVVVYNIVDPAYIDLDFPSSVYAYPGPITQVEFVHSRLHTIGIYNWYEVYDLSAPSAPVRSGKLINPPYRPVGMCFKGDTLFVADTKTKTFFPALDDGIGDPVSISPFFTVLDSMARPYLVNGYFGDMDLLYYFNEHRLNGSARRSDFVLANFIRWSFPTGITAAVFYDEYFYRASSKAVLFIYEVDEDYHLNEITRLPFQAQVHDMVRVDRILYAATNGLRTYSLLDPQSPELIDTKSETGTVYDLYIKSGQMYCATQTGLYIYDITAGIPQLLFSGGDPAYHIAADDDIVATSDSFSVGIYTLPVSGADDGRPMVFEAEKPRLRGYPNPFNPEIRLILENFRGDPSALKVEVFDVLGRLMRRLEVPRGGAYRYEVQWDGRDERGRRVATGIYLFRAGNGDQQAVFKAVLLK